MKKAILESKWWFYIPIISIFFLKKMVDWVFEAKTTVEISWRHVIISYTLFLHAIPIIYLINYIFKL